MHEEENKATNFFYTEKILETLFKSLDEDVIVSYTNTI